MNVKRKENWSQYGTSGYSNFTMKARRFNTESIWKHANWIITESFFPSNIQDNKRICKKQLKLPETEEKQHSTQSFKKLNYEPWVCCHLLYTDYKSSTVEISIYTCLETFNVNQHTHTQSLKRGRVFNTRPRWSSGESVTWTMDSGYTDLCCLCWN